MYKYDTRDIRNVCILSHSHAGKTSLVEALLHKAGVIDRISKVADGNTVSDYDGEEIKRCISISTTIEPLEWKKTKINIIDTPGYADFVGEMIEGVRVSGSAIIMVSGKSGVSSGTERAWGLAKRKDIPVVFFVNKLDDVKSDYVKTITELKQTFGNSVAPILFPIKDGDRFTGFIDIVKMQAKIFADDGSYKYEAIPEGLRSLAESQRAMLMEAVAEVSDENMEKYFNGEEFTEEEIDQAIKYGMKYGTMSIVLAGSVLQDIGVEILLDDIVKYLPAPDEVFLHKAEEKLTKNPIEIVCDKDKPLIVRVFKTVVDPYFGKMSYFKIMSGTVKADSTVYNADKEKTEKIGKLYVIRGKKLIDVPELYAGDIGVVTKLTVTDTCDCLCIEKYPIIMPKFRFPKPVLSMAIVPKAKGDDEKISNGLKKLMSEDPTFNVYRNHETHQTIIEGMGEQHISVILAKLKTKFGVEADLIEPKIAYREAIRTKVKTEGKHKKQSGGHGQFGHVWIEFEPGEEDGLTFCENVFGGSVPKNYFPAVEKGLQEAMEHGVLAGYPMVGLKATLVDGSYHPVDSSELAFKTAAHLAYKAAMEQAKPVILEPIGTLVVTAKNIYTGDIVGDINKRRGRILGMNPIDGDSTEVIAEVPVAEMGKYAIDLRAITSGRGEFSFDFTRYEDAPNDVTQKIIAEAKTE